MPRIILLSAVLIGLMARAQDVVAVSKAVAGDPRFPASLTSQIGGKRVRLVLTGTAMRRKYGFNVYAIGSYVQEGVKVRDAEGLARVAAAKQLCLIFERAVDGETVAKAFRSSIGMSHPAPAFAAELASMERYVRAHPPKQGDQFWLTYLPGEGLGCQVLGKPGVVVKGVAFAQAAWETYLGPNNLGVAIKSGLTSRL